MKITSVNFFNEFFIYFHDQKGASEKTIRTYRFALKGFYQWWLGGHKGSLDPGDVTSIDLREYQGYLQNIKKRKPAGINLYMKAIKVFLKWALNESHINRIPVFPKHVQEQKAPPKALERNEQNRLLREVERRGNLRDMALVRLLMSCGLRVSEVAALQVSDLETGERHGKLTVRQGKGNKWREVPVPTEARKVIREWLAERDKKSAASPWLFPNRIGGHITARCVEQVIGKLAKFADLDIYPHALRHASLTTTAVYTKPDSRTMADAVERGEV
ncbi:MAG: Tyrosine recombinase XerC [Pelotomaculum sp. PtaU1.Bin065]|nr:MAG: Tyrosine recombinase XerC [Pelotomaculum sp. PtaU1.Bin065]